ncbi:MAG: hypothetical protein JW748_07575 [Anaerolineales bacterium]|nr:hypothetical protein [Anaerolineales bacterium]
MKTTTVILPDRVPITCPGKAGILRLAATKIVFGKYKDDQGKEHSGWTAALSMMLGEDRQTYKAFKVHGGKSVQFGRFNVNVHRIESSPFGMLVKAEVASAE